MNNDAKNEKRDSILRIKYVMEDEILKAIQTFENETGFTVTSVTFRSNASVTGIASDPGTWSIESGVTIR